jgi:hypothetical protein
LPINQDLVMIQPERPKNRHPERTREGSGQCVQGPLASPGYFPNKNPSDAPARFLVRTLGMTACMKKPLLLCAVILIAAASTAHAVLIKRETKPAPERGPDIVRKTVEVQLPEGVLSYIGTAQKGQTKAIVGKYGDHSLGLEFGRPARVDGRPSNGGWNLWNFLQANVQVNGKSFSATSAYLLEDAYLLEEGQRTIVALRWPVEAPVKGKEAPKSFTLTLLEDASMPHWLFIRVSAADAPLEKVALSCYPANTSGPKQRQRWTATADHRYEVGPKPTDLPVSAEALAYFNQLAQTRGGCFLIYNPAQIQSLNVAGGYDVHTTFVPKKGAHDAVFALGFFIDQPADQAMQYFFTESREQVARYLKSIDWTPRFNPRESQELIQFVDRVLKQYPQPAQAAEWSGLKKTYTEALSARRPIDTLSAARQMEAFKQKLLQRILATYK